MENNEITIKMSMNDITTALDHLTVNENFLNLNKNVFSVDCIKTCFDVEKTYSNSLKNLSCCCFKISYNDGNVKNIFTIECDLKNTTSYGFLKNNTFMDDDQLEILVEKIYNNVFNVVDNTKEYDIDSISNDLYNEALIFVTSGINKEECKSIKNDFETKFENYITVQSNENDKIIGMMEDLYNKIIEIKTK
jgi:hypothetical protein